ncbi:WD40-repeat-containing domain protein [Russula emetica]|nr:WD40-repeat-containing domain protein [Russula emetica]
MMHSPSSSTQREVLVNCTNVTIEPIHNNPKPPPTPAAHALFKRSRPADDSSARLKRLKFSIGESRTRTGEDERGDSADESEEESDSDSSSITYCSTARRKRTIFQAKNALAMSRPGVTCRPLPLPTRSLLRAYVSSHKTDVFTCISGRTDSFLTPPYACAFTNAAKRGAVPHLAVATEQGTVYIWDTSKREALEQAPNRVDLDIHENGIFDLQWSTDDTSLATCSGDHTTRITDVPTGKTLHLLRGHTSTVKTVLWDPQHDSLLSTGGRDGGIRVWDLRIATRTSHSVTSHDESVITIDGAHGQDKQANGGGRRRKIVPSARTVTSLIYPEGRSDRLISSGSFDGSNAIQPAAMSAFDPTTVEGGRRARGLASIVSGTGPTYGLLFGLGVDSRVHTYAVSTLLPLIPNMNTNSFWVRLAISPDGRSIVSGSSATGKEASAFLYDVSQTAMAAPSILPDTAGVELHGQKGEVGGVDWAQDMLATCTDDGTVRVWRFDPETRQRCDLEPDAQLAWAWGIDSL